MWYLFDGNNIAGTFSVAVGLDITECCLMFYVRNSAETAGYKTAVFGVMYNI